MLRPRRFGEETHCLERLNRLRTTGVTAVPPPHCFRTFATVVAVYSMPACTSTRASQTALLLHARSRPPDRRTSHPSPRPRPGLHSHQHHHTQQHLNSLSAARWTNSASASSRSVEKSHMRMAAQPLVLVYDTSRRHVGAQRPQKKLASTHRRATLITLPTRLCSRSLIRRHLARPIWYRQGRQLWPSERVWRSDWRRSQKYHRFSMRRRITEH